MVLHFRRVYLLAGFGLSFFHFFSQFLGNVHISCFPGDTVIEMYCHRLHCFKLQSLIIWKLKRNTNSCMLLQLCLFPSRMQSLEMLRRWYFPTNLICYMCLIFCKTNGQTGQAYYSSARLQALMELQILGKNSIKSILFPLYTMGIMVVFKCEEHETNPWCFLEASV